MIKLSMGYPDEKSEIDVYKGRSYAALDKVCQVLGQDELIRMRDEVKMVHIEEEMYEYVAKLVRATRENQYVGLGISPRGGLALICMAKATAFMYGRDYVVPEDVQSCVNETAMHRIVLNSKAKANGVNEEDVLQMIIKEVLCP